MHLSRRETLPLPLEVLYPLLRDRLHLLVDALPDVAAIDAEARVVGRGGVARVDRWRTRPLRRLGRWFTSPVAEWRMRSAWDDTSHAATWDAELLQPVARVTSRGALSLQAAGDGNTVVSLTGEIALRSGQQRPRPLSGVFVAGALAAVAQPLVAQVLDQNLAAMARALGHFGPAAIACAG